MKIEIDLNDILGDEYGAETIQESVKRQVVEKMSLEIKSGIGRKIDEELARLIQETLKKSLEEVSPKLITELMDAEYISVDRYGSRSKEKTTFRTELVKAIQEQMVYKTESYRDRQSFFTNAVDEVVQNEVSKFKTEFNGQVNNAYLQQTMEYAVKVLKERLNIK